MAEKRLIILGAGPGGYVAAIKAAQLGAKVTIIEDTEVGGTCLNRGCIPTKALIASAEAIDKIKRAEEYGIEIKGEVSCNLSKIIERKNKVVAVQVKGIRSLFKSWGIELLEGRGKIKDVNKVEIALKDGSSRTAEGDNIIIATGSRPARISLFSFDGKDIITSDEALNITEIPKGVLIVGAGVIGCEFAFILKELGAEVTIVEMLSHAVATEDEEISEILERELKKRKIKLILNTKIEKIERDIGGGLTAFLSDGKQIKTEKVLVSIGRALNTENIGIEELGIKKGKNGEIEVNNRMETNVKGIYAIGDVVGGIMLAHVASTEGIVAAENIMGHSREIDYNIVPAGIFTMPEIGSVGLREKQANEKGMDIKVGRFQFRGLGKAHAMGEIAGMAKIIADAKTDKVLGLHIIGAHAADLVHEGAVAMKLGAKVKDIANTIHAHPTLSEAIMEASEDLHKMAIHLPKP
ncbi:MAG: dihydrolipoyl dehydrogenase [Nitrospirae bacterium]|nr:dihydrolipoyl dehydrogenase [Nitrospirota bacterium]